MPLIRAAIAAVPEPNRGLIRFVMKDGGRRVDVVVSNAALDDLHGVSAAETSYFHRFKTHRLQFEIIASRKYDKGYVERDGSVCIKAGDMPFVCSD